MANILHREKQLLVLRLLVEGNSIRSTERITGVRKRTIINLIVKFGERCRSFLDSTLRDLDLAHVECDEIWTFCGKKQRRLTDAEKHNPQLGDQYLYVAQDQDTNLIVTYAVGKRNSELTGAFIDDLALRMVLPDNNASWNEKPQISTDGWAPYPGAIYDAFESRVKYGTIIKSYADTEQPGRYAPPDVTATERRSVMGVQNLATICTSHVERNNLTIRTFMKRFTRLSLGFSKKLENLAAAIAIHVAYFNFCWRPRENKGGRHRLPPAMQAGVVSELWDIERLYDEVMA